jgi:hypothetical protein
MAHSVEEIRSVLVDVRDQLMGKANVVATGIGYKISEGKRTEELSIICSVENKKSKSYLRPEDMISTQISGIPTDVVPTGPVTIFQDPTDRFRPAPGGVSVGHYQITAGTLGCLVRKNGVLYILSNNHVLANSNDASEGDPILQPGSADGGQTSQDEIAKLSIYVPIVFEENGGNGGGSCPVAGLTTNVLNALAAMTGSKTRLRQYRIRQTENNRVDCAIALPNNPDDVKNEILEIGTISGITEGILGMNIQKSGRTTGLTTGTIQQVDVTARVNFGANRTAVFEDQLLAGGMSQGGDSGSAVLDTDNNLVGLLFAGSSNTTIINRIQNVFSELEVGLPV